MSNHLANLRVTKIRQFLPSVVMLAPMLLATAFCSSAAVAAGCFPLDLPSDLEFGGASATIAIYGAPTAQIDGGALDYFDAWFFDEAIGMTGTFALGSGLNSSLSNCIQCIKLCVDFHDGECEKDLFADQGTLELITAPGEEVLQFNLRSWHFAEVTTDNQGVSTPVPGGDCYIASDDAIFSDWFGSP